MGRSNTTDETGRTCQTNRRGRTNITIDLESNIQQVAQKEGIVLAELRKYRRGRRN